MFKFVGNELTLVVNEFQLNVINLLFELHYPLQQLQQILSKFDCTNANTQKQ